METDGNALVSLSATGYQSTQKIKKKQKTKKGKKKQMKRKQAEQTQRKFKPLVSHLDPDSEFVHMFFLSLN